MAAKKKTTPKVEEKIEEVVLTEDVNAGEVEIPVVEAPAVEEKPKKEAKKDVKVEKEPKYKVGSIVFVSKEAGADLNGFKLFPQYKKYTYTVEAYDAISDVYTLRRLNLSLKLKEAFILAPDEKAHDELNRKQF